MRVEQLHGPEPRTWASGFVLRSWVWSRRAGGQHKCEPPGGFPWKGELRFLANVSKVSLRQLKAIEI